MSGIELLIELHPYESRFFVAPPGVSLRPGDLEVYLPTAVYYPDFPANEGFNLFLNGWASAETNMSFKCCILRMLPSGQLDTVVEVQAYSYHEHVTQLASMQSAEYSCSFSSLLIAFIGRAKFTHMTFAESSCEKESGKVLEIVYPPQQHGTVGVCLKLSCDYVDPKKMLEWFEYQRMMNVTKVFTYTLDLDEPTMRVFQYYQRIGFLDLQTFGPASLQLCLQRRLGRARYELQVMAVKDCKHRMSGYDYIMVLDYNDFIVPHEPLKTYYDILQKVSKMKPVAGAFGFDCHDVMLDRGPTRESPLHIMRSWYRATQANSRGVDHGSHWAFKPKITYSAQSYYNQDLVRNPCTEVFVPHNLYTLLHYQYCRKTGHGCMDRERSRDDIMLTHEATLVEKIRQLPLDQILHKRMRYKDILNK